ncbi:MAG: AMP-binding protein [Acidimicrobiales bacterium]
MSDNIFGIEGIWQLLEERANRSGDRTMLIDPKAARQFSFRQVRDWAERVAAGLAELGVVEGTPVTWLLPTRVETVVASFALSRLGAVQNPIIHIYRDKEVGFCLRQTNAQMVLVPGEWSGFDYTAMVERVTADLELRPTIIDAYKSLPEGNPATLPELPTPPKNPDEAPIRWIYFTSGTTSDPKGVKHSDATLIAGGVGLAKALDMSADDVGSIGFPYAHIGGPDYMITMLTSGFPAILIEKFVLDDVISALKEYGGTMAGGSTAFYTMFLAEQRKNPETPLIPSLRMLSGGGAPKPPEVYFEVKAEMGIPVAHGYGMTECPMIAQGSPHDSDEQLANSEGHPVQGCEVSIVGDDDELLSPNTEGEIRVAGPMLFRGYTDESLMEGAFDDSGRFRTGDLGEMDADGYLTLTGRLKDVIIRKGENISAKEIEEVLYAHPAVAGVAVIGLPDPERGERVCAVVESNPEVDRFTFDELRRTCSNAGLMQQKIPEQLEIVEALPRNATMKILKHELRDRFA